MQARMKKPHTETILYYVECPTPKTAKDAKDFLERMGCKVSDSVDAREVFPDRSAGTLLAGARYREDLTQVELSSLSGIPRRHISEMENNKRPIGKTNARKLAKALNMDYRTLL
ncbi:MAG: helix-turn-helix transcriptional regulator [Desulfovibrionaceae bacterium]|nr:helix-turn-helix transcriptional regulator [Desulfovibrionaceae bacterium]